MIEKNIMGADNFVYGMREYLANKWDFFSIKKLLSSNMSD